MFDHIGLRVRDLGAASRLYAAMLAPLARAAARMSRCEPPAGRPSSNSMPKA